LKGIILAGGTGSRLLPLTKITNKHLLPVGQYPMIYYSIYKLKEAGINELLVVTGKEHMGDVVNLLGSGCDFEVNITYKVQDQAGGIAQALGLAKHFVANENMVVVLGDNIFENSIAAYINDFKNQTKGAKILLSRVEDPQRYGVPTIKGERITEIEEKPDKPKSPYAVTGIYMYDPSVFEIINHLKPSERGELEITDVNNEYVNRLELSYNVLDGWWTDAGTHNSLAKANELTRGIRLPIKF